MTAFSYIHFSSEVSLNIHGIELNMTCVGPLVLNGIFSKFILHGGSLVQIFPNLLYFGKALGGGRGKERIAGRINIFQRIMRLFFWHS